MPNITAPQNTAASSTTAMRRKTSNACARRRAVCILPVSGSESAMRKTVIRAANIPAIQHSAVTASCDSGTSTCTGADFAYTNSFRISFVIMVPSSVPAPSAGRHRISVSNVSNSLSCRFVMPILRKRAIPLTCLRS